MSAPIKTLYVIPHAHTDFGYTHDPVITWELHDRFLDRAIELCESTTEMEPASAFHWTIEVFATLEHWWTYRDADWHRRLLDAVERRQLDVGVRYTNGTMLLTHEDIEWELDRAVEWANDHNIGLSTAMQNDVNGFSMAYAHAMARRGLTSLMMGLNTTMGHSPCPRPAAWRWALPNDHELLVWHGWIYNRLKSFINLDQLADELPGKVDSFFAHLPEDYPLDFAAVSGTVNDNVGPFTSLPEQVRRFNDGDHGLRLVLTTASGFMNVLARHRDKLPVKHGDWTDCWVFGHGSMPQEVGALRRAQRKMMAIDRIRSLGWADDDGGTLSYNRARRHISLACEHTYGSHSSVSAPESTDTQRQWAQIQIDFWTAESVATGLLRDHLATTAGSRGVKDPSALLINPFPVPLNFRAIYEDKAMETFARVRHPEHLYQLDREPTRAAMEKGNLICHAPLEPETALLVTLEHHAPRNNSLPVSMDQVIEIGDDLLRVAYDPSEHGIVSVTTTEDGREWCLNDPFALFAPVREVPREGGFTVRNTDNERDPSDESWRQDISCTREISGEIERLEWVRDARGEALIVHRLHSPMRRQIIRFDPLLPGVLDLTADFWFEADTTRQAFYLSFGWWLDPGEPVHFFYDSSGMWLQADRDQLPGAARSLYEVGMGVAVTQGDRTVTIASRDVPLWQFGGFTFGDPAADVPRQKPFLASWVYNNYWGCNFNACSPGGFSCRYLIAPTVGTADPALAAQLYWQFAADDLVHPLMPRAETQF